MAESIAEIVAENERIENVLASGVRERLLAVPGVVHVTTGLKEVGGRAIDELCVKTYVQRKLAVAELTGDPVPSMVDGIRTDVTEIPEIRYCSDESMHRPLVGGIQITNGIRTLNAAHTIIFLSRGTLGCFATRNADGKPVLLTNSHVALANGGQVGDSLFQPLALDEADRLDEVYPKRPKSGDNAIGTIVDAQVTGKVDAAIARIDTCYSLCCNCGVSFSNVIRDLAIGGSNAVAGSAPSPVVAGQKVVKVGRTTDRTSGTVVTANFPEFTTVPDPGDVPHTYTGQIQIQGDNGPFAGHGDSGSVVVDSSRRVVGLVFSSAPQDAFALANHIADVLSTLKITISGSEHSLVMAAEQDEFVNLLAARGAGISERVAVHQSEIVTLVNHDRHVTVVWHRIQGPSWLAALARSAREPAYRIPDAIAGVTRLDAVTRLLGVLGRHGSAELRADVDRYSEQLRTAFSTRHTTDELLNVAVPIGSADVQNA